MRDSDFWHDLAAEFSALDRFDKAISASWHEEVGTGSVRWALRGAESTKVEFDPLARRAGQRYPTPQSGDLLSIWLNAIRKEIPSSDREGSGTGQSETGEQTNFKFGTIQRLSLLSSQLCRRIESRTLESETGQIASSGTFAAVKEHRGKPFISTIENLLSILGDATNIVSEELSSTVTKLLRGISRAFTELMEELPSSTERDVLRTQLHVTLGLLGNLINNERSLPVEVAATEKRQPITDETLKADTSIRVTTREERLKTFIREVKSASIADVCRTAQVYKANMQQWRHGELSEDSVMSQRIEDVLAGKIPLVTKGKKKG